MPRRLRTALPILVLLALDAALIAVTRLPIAPGNAWYKGPLIDPLSPYTPATAFQVLGVCAAAALDLGLLLTYAAWRRLRRVPARRRKAATAGAALLVLAGSLALTEAGLRVYLDTVAQTMFRPDPDYFWTLTPGLENYFNANGGEWLSTNRLGWRAPEVPRRKGDDEVRVLTLGDSSGYGLGVPQDQTWSTVLQRLLAADLPGRRVTVFNAACPGHTTHQGVLLLRENLDRVRPDLVIVGYNNDPAPEYVTDADRQRRAGWSRGAKRLLYRSHLYIIVRQVVLGFVRGHALTWIEGVDGAPVADLDQPSTRRVLLDEYRANLGTMRELTAAVGADLVLIRMPVNPDVPDLVEMFYDPEYVAALRETAADLDVPLVDVQERWEARRCPSFLLGHVFHPDARGHAMMAEQIHDRLASTGWIRRMAGDAGAPATAGTMTPLRLGYSRLTPLHCLVGEVLRSTDIAQRHGFDPRFRRFTRGDEQNAAAPDLDATFTCEVPAIHFLSTLPDWQVAGVTGSLGVVAVVARAGAGIESIGDLRGRRVGVAPGSTSHMDLEAWLAAAGLDPATDLEVVEMGLRDQAEALDAGAVDAVATWDPWVSQLRLAGNAVVTQRPFWSLIVLRRGFVEGDDDAAGRYLACVSDALDHARRHRDQVLAAVAEASGLDRAVLALVLDASGQMRDPPTGPVALDAALPDLARGFAFVRKTTDEGPWRAFADGRFLEIRTPEGG